MNFIKNYQSNFLCVLPIFRPGDTVPLFRSRHDDICSVQCLKIRSEVATQFNNRFFYLLHSWHPVFQSLLHQRFEWGYVHTFLFRIRLKQVQNCQFTHDGFTASCWSTDQNVFVSLVEREKDLSLDGVEEVELRIQRFENGVFEG